LRTFVEVLFSDQPVIKSQLLRNRVYATMGDALAGVHELVAVMLVSRAVEERNYDYLVLDTAPSRYALDFVTYPGRLASLLEGSVVSWFARLADRVTEHGPAPRGRLALVEWGKRRVEGLLGKVLHPRFVRDLTELFALLLPVRHRFAETARRAERLLLGPAARYLLVAAPTRSAEADVAHLAERLSRLGPRPFAVLLNRADEDLPGWARTLDSYVLPLPLREAISKIVAERSARRRAANRTAEELIRRLPAAPCLRLPTFESTDPSHTVRRLSEVIGKRLADLGIHVKGTELADGTSSEVAAKGALLE
jgi:anion-transporting  ArsA/GET3 family ATPase